MSDYKFSSDTLRRGGNRALTIGAVLIAATVTSYKFQLVNILVLFAMWMLAGAFFGLGLWGRLNAGRVKDGKRELGWGGSECTSDSTIPRV